MWIIKNYTKIWICYCLNMETSSTSTTNVQVNIVIVKKIHEYPKNLN